MRRKVKIGSPAVWSYGPVRSQMQKLREIGRLYYLSVRCDKAAKRALPAVKSRWELSGVFEYSGIVESTGSTVFQDAVDKFGHYADETCMSLEVTRRHLRHEKSRFVVPSTLTVLSQTFAESIKSMRVDYMERFPLGAPLEGSMSSLAWVLQAWRDSLSWANYFMGLEE